jgi:putative ATPase
MRELGYGRDYSYPHDAPGGFVPDGNLPEGLGSAAFYEPRAVGAERAIHERLEEWRKRRADSASTRSDEGPKGSS